METITEEGLNSFLDNWNKFKTSYEKVNSIVEDLTNCKNDITKTILVNTISKILENAGIKEKFFQ